MQIVYFTARKLPFNASDILLDTEKVLFDRVTDSAL